MITKIKRRLNGERTRIIHWRGEKKTHGKITYTEKKLDKKG